MWDEDSFFIVSLLVFHLPILWSNVSNVPEDSISIYLLFKDIVYFIFGCGQYILIAFFINMIRIKSLRIIIQIVLGFICATIAIADLFLLATMQEYLDQFKIMIVLGTNPTTVKEYLLTYVLRWKMLLGIAFLTVLLYFTIRKVSNHTKHKLVRCGLALVFAAGVLGTFMAWSIKVYQVGANGTPLRVAIGDMNFVHQVMSKSNVLYRVGLDTFLSIKLVGSTDEIHAYLDANQEKIIENKADIPYVVFILNESVDRNHMSLYGYSNKTTPRREKRYAEGNLFVFTDTIACGNNTTGCMQKIFSFSNKDDTDSWYHKANVFDILKQAGYETYWFSNQSPAGFWGNMGKIYGDRCTQSVFVMTNGGGSGEKIILDDALLPVLDRHLVENSGERQFILLHLHGTHEPYKYRYPSAEGIFTAEDEQGEIEKWREEKAIYDNAILYNDKIVEAIIHRFEEDDAIVIEISDHGNEVYDGRDFIGHSGEVLGNRHMVEIPFVIWVSKTFRNKRPALLERISNSVNNPFRTDDMIHVLLDIMSIKTETYDATRSVISDEYLSRTRIYGGKEYKKE